MAARPCDAGLQWSRPIGRRSEMRRGLARMEGSLCGAVPPRQPAAAVSLPPQRQAGRPRGRVARVEAAIRAAVEARRRRALLRREPRPLKRRGQRAAGLRAVMTNKSGGQHGFRVIKRVTGRSRIRSIRDHKGILGLR